MTETLCVPEEHLEEVILVIRNGLKNTKKLSKDVRLNLKKWCEEEEQYLKDMQDDDNE